MLPLGSLTASKEGATGENGEPGEIVLSLNFRVVPRVHYDREKRVSNMFVLNVCRQSPPWNANYSIVSKCIMISLSVYIQRKALVHSIPLLL